MSSPGCKVLCFVMSFLVLWSICLSSSLVHFKNGSEYLTRGTARGFIHLMRCRLYSLVSSNFLVLLRYSFVISFLSPLVRWFPLPIFPNTCNFPFLREFLFCLDLVVLFLPYFAVFRFSLLVRHVFLCQIPLLYPDWISSQPILGFPIIIIIIIICCCVLVSEHK